MPNDAEVMLRKLEDFEKSELQKARSRISEKRADVADFLQQILERETKKGNLEAAISVKEQILRLNPVNSDKTADVTVSTNQDKIQKAVGIWSWTIPTRKLLVKQGSFFSISLGSGGSIDGVLKHVEGRKFELVRENPNGEQSDTVEFDHRFDSAILTTPEGKPKTIRKISK